MASIQKKTTAMSVSRWKRRIKKETHVGSTVDWMRFYMTEFQRKLRYVLAVKGIDRMIRMCEVNAKIGAKYRKLVGKKRKRKSAWTS